MLYKKKIIIIIHTWNICSKTCTSCYCEWILFIRITQKLIIYVRNNGHQQNNKQNIAKSHANYMKEKLLYHCSSLFICIYCREKNKIFYRLTVRVYQVLHRCIIKKYFQKYNRFIIFQKSTSITPKPVWDPDHCVAVH